MEPIDTFSDALDRSRRLLRLHDGLVNVRKRGIRKDWSKSFCKVMRWPLATKLARVDSADAVLVLRSGADLTANDFDRESLDDLLRAALTLGVSALDRYVHERVVKRLVVALGKPQLKKSQEQLPVSAAFALRVSRKALVAKPGKGAYRPANEIRNELQEQLHRKPFQSWREIESAFELVGISGLAGKLQAAYAAASASAFQGELDQIARRRNQIVHEADLVRHKRGGKPKRHTITRRFVEGALDFLEDFVNKLEAIHP